jgi:hypothetical protein
MAADCNFSALRVDWEKLKVSGDRNVIYGGNILFTFVYWLAAGKLSALASRQKG